jgi:transmembrane sensor
MSGTPQPDRSLRREAHLWLARRDGSQSPEDEAAFGAWLDADPAHRIAYEDSLRVWSAIEEPLQRRVEAEQAAPRRRAGGRRWLMLVACVALSGAAVWSFAPLP